MAKRDSATLITLLLWLEQCIYKQIVKQTDLTELDSTYHDVLKNFFSSASRVHTLSESTHTKTKQNNNKQTTTKNKKTTPTQSCSKSSDMDYHLRRFPPLRPPKPRLFLLVGLAAPSTTAPPVRTPVISPAMMPWKPPSLDGCMSTNYHQQQQQQQQQQLKDSSIKKDLQKACSAQLNRKKKAC